MLNTEELLNVIVNALDDVKAKDIVVFDTTGKTSAFTRVVVCSGTSNRQTRALGMSVSRAVREAGGKVSGLEGSDTGEWVLVDCGEVVVHCMQPAMRSYYNLEDSGVLSRSTFRPTSNRWLKKAPTRPKPLSNSRSCTSPS